jgi:hypothetical protein
LTRALTFVRPGLSGFVSGAVRPRWSRSENKTKEKAMSQPAQKIRISNLQVTVWRNSSDKGNWYSVIPSRSYKQGDDWKETTSLGFDDLLTMAKLFDMAHTWIMHQQLADAKGRKESAQAAA